MTGAPSTCGCDRGCSNYTRGSCIDNPGRSPIAAFSAEKWCDECIASHALTGSVGVSDKEAGNE